MDYWGGGGGGEEVGAKGMLAPHLKLLGGGLPLCPPPSSYAYGVDYIRSNCFHSSGNFITINVSLTWPPISLSARSGPRL